MDRPAQFFDYNIDGEDDEEYQVFVPPDPVAQRSHRRTSATGPVAESVPVTIAPAPRRLLPAAIPPRPPSSQSSLPLPSIGGVPLSGLAGHSGQFLLPSVDRSNLDTPGLSSGSSATPASRASTKLVTPEGLPTSSSQAAPRKMMAPFPPPPVPPPPPRKRRPRKQKPKEPLTEQQEEVKRNKFLERNRVAATKCRQKKKDWVSDLEGTKDELETKHAHLQSEHRGLVEELSQIRAQLMNHANCGDGNINSWIENEAKRFVLRAGERYDAMLANFGQPQPPSEPQLRHPSLSSASSYPQSTSQNLMSPMTTRGSISLPQSAAQPGSPVFFRGSVSADPTPAPGPSTQPPPYASLPPSVHTETDFDHLHILDEMR